MVAVKLHDSINNVDKFLFWVYHMYLIHRPNRYSSDMLITKYKVTFHPCYIDIYLHFATRYSVQIVLKI